MELRTQIFQAYKTLYVQHAPAQLTLKAVAEAAGLTEHELKAEFPTLKELAGATWEAYFHESLAMAQSDAIYAEYIARQKLLALYFSLFEVVKPDHAFIEKALDARSYFEWTPDYLEPLKKAFLDHVKELVAEGIAIEEVESRMTLSNYYVEPHWYQMLFLLSFWAGDVSKEYEKTDEAIEKAVNLGFDLMGRNVLDSAWEFGKFWWTNR